MAEEEQHHKNRFLADTFSQLSHVQETLKKRRELLERESKKLPAMRFGSSPSLPTSPPQQTSADVSNLSLTRHHESRHTSRSRSRGRLLSTKSHSCSPTPNVTLFNQSCTETNNSCNSACDETQSVATPRSGAVTPTTAAPLFSHTGSQANSRSSSRGFALRSKVHSFSATAPRSRFGSTGRGRPPLARLCAPTASSRQHQRSAAASRHGDDASSQSNPSASPKAHSTTSASSAAHRFKRSLVSRSFRATPAPSANTSRVPSPAPRFAMRKRSRSDVSISSHVTHHTRSRDISSERVNGEADSANASNMDENLSMKPSLTPFSSAWRSQQVSPGGSRHRSHASASRSPPPKETVLSPIAQRTAELSNGTTGNDEHHSGRRMLSSVTEAATSFASPAETQGSSRSNPVVSPSPQWLASSEGVETRFAGGASLLQPAAAALSAEKEENGEEEEEERAFSHSQGRQHSTSPAQVRVTGEATYNVSGALPSAYELEDSVATTGRLSEFAQPLSPARRSSLMLHAVASNTSGQTPRTASRSRQPLSRTPPPPSLSPEAAKRIIASHERETSTLNADIAADEGATITDSVTFRRPSICLSPPRADSEVFPPTHHSVSPAPTHEQIASSVKNTIAEQNFSGRSLNPPRTNTSVTERESLRAMAASRSFSMGCGSPTISPASTTGRGDVDALQLQKIGCELTTPLVAPHTGGNEERPTSMKSAFSQAIAGTSVSSPCLADPFHADHTQWPDRKATAASPAPTPQSVDESAFTSTCQMERCCHRPTPRSAESIANPLPSGEQCAPVSPLGVASASRSMSNAAHRDTQPPQTTDAQTAAVQVSCEVSECAESEGFSACVSAPNTPVPGAPITALTARGSVVLNSTVVCSTSEIICATTPNDDVVTTRQSNTVRTSEILVFDVTEEQQKEKRGIVVEDKPAQEQLIVPRGPCMSVSPQPAASLPDLQGTSTVADYELRSRSSRPVSPTPKLVVSADITGPIISIDGQTSHPKSTSPHLSRANIQPTTPTAAAAGDGIEMHAVTLSPAKFSTSPREGRSTPYPALEASLANNDIGEDSNELLSNSESESDSSNSDNECSDIDVECEVSDISTETPLDFSPPCRRVESREESSRAHNTDLEFTPCTPTRQSNKRSVSTQGRKSEVQRLIESCPADARDELEKALQSTPLGSQLSEARSPSERLRTSGTLTDDSTISQRVAARPRKYYYDYTYLENHVNEAILSEKHKSPHKVKSQVKKKKLKRAKKEIASAQPAEDSQRTFKKANKMMKKKNKEMNRIAADANTIASTAPASASINHVNRSQLPMGGSMSKKNRKAMKRKQQKRMNQHSKNIQIQNAKATIKPIGEHKKNKQKKKKH